VGKGDCNILFIKIWERNILWLWRKLYLVMDYFLLMHWGIS
jgi:hypothetical protein